jgi:hypothetical protein
MLKIFFSPFYKLNAILCKDLTACNKQKLFFGFLFYFLFIYSIRPCLAKPYFISLENCQNELKCVFAKHPLR